jgi:hypothetical protein
MLRGIAEQVSAATGLECSVSDLERVLLAVLASAEPWRVVGLAYRPFNLVVEALQQMEAAGLLSFSNGVAVHLTSAGRELCRKRRLHPHLPQRCPTCEGRSVSLEGFAEALHRFERLAEGRPPPLGELDQAHVTPASTMARLALMADRGDLNGKSLIILGDDDLMGLAAALTGLPQRVVVLELDQRLTDFIAEAARRQHLAVEVLSHDLRLPLPKELVSSFDTFFTEPPDALGGMSLFISRGIEALKGDGASGYFGYTMVESSLHRWRELQRGLVQECGVVITDIIRDFSTYLNWPFLLEEVPAQARVLQRMPEEPWYRSFLYRIELLGDSGPFRDPSPQGELYHSKESMGKN